MITLLFCMRAGLYYGAEAHLVTSITMNGTAKLTVFGATLSQWSSSADLHRHLCNPGHGCRHSYGIQCDRPRVYVCCASCARAAMGVTALFTTFSDASWPVP